MPDTALDSITDRPSSEELHSWAIQIVCEEMEDRGFAPRFDNEYRVVLFENKDKVRYGVLVPKRNDSIDNLTVDGPFELFMPFADRKLHNTSKDMGVEDLLRTNLLLLDKLTDAREVKNVIGERLTRLFGKK